MRITSKFAVLLVAPLLAGLPGACASNRPLTLNDDLVVPGERVGEVQIGMPLATLMAIKGTPINTIPIRGSAATTYVFDGVTVAAHDEVYWIIANDERFHTASGVRPGAEQIFARASLGQPKCVASRGKTTTYDYGNIYFDVDNTTGKVMELGVQKKTQTCMGGE